MDPNSLALLMGSAGAAAGPATYVEDVFQTWLYTGNGSTQTITNGVDLSGKGGFVWIKKRGSADNHALFDTARGNTKRLSSNLANAESTITDEITAFNSSGFTLGAGSTGFTNDNGVTFASWTFRKQAKFFDVVTYTGNGTSQNISHSLGSTPGAVIIKATSAAYAWPVWHRSLATNDHLRLNTTDAAFTAASYVSGVSSTTFSVGSGSQVNDSGVSYVAYLFAHDAGGFGDSGNDSIIKCGSFTTDGSGNATVNLGWEPQWVMMKASSTTGSWNMHDTMRGYTAASGNSRYNFLYANDSSAEVSGAGDYGGVTSTGFTVKSLSASATYIYIAIRRGPMKTPTDATKVFSAIARAGTGAAATVTGVGFPTDLVGTKARDSGDGCVFRDRLRGTPASLLTFSASAETTATDAITSFNMDGISLGTDATEGRTNTNFVTYVNWFFRRAPGFFDVVAFTAGSSADRSVNHNLGVAPQLIITKPRSNSASWYSYTADGGRSKWLLLNGTAGYNTGTNAWGTSDPTSTTFNVDETFLLIASATYIAYLFASCPGVSKVGSYTGTGTTLSIDCGFTNGARFVLIKRTDSAGAWYVWDTARGIIANNDPYLLLNSIAAEVTNTDYIDPLNSGFQISSTAPAAINANGGSYIYLSVA